MVHHVFLGKATCDSRLSHTFAKLRTVSGEVGDHPVTLVIDGK